jgi:hypothetical protein
MFKNKCESKNSLIKKLELCFVELKKFKNYKNLTDQKKYFKLMDTLNNLENQIENLNIDKKLTEEEVLHIITIYKLDGKERNEIKEKLMNLTYDNKYVSRFTGKPSLNLYSMANDKLSSFLKYGDEI